MNTIRFLAVAIALIAILQICIVIVPGEAEAVGTMIATITMDQAEQTAQVAPGQTGIVRFTGSVHYTVPIDCSGPFTANITLEGEAGDWECKIIPSNVTLSRYDSDATFVVSVRVPPLTSHIETRQLEVSGNGTTIKEGMNVEFMPVHAMVNVKQFYRFEVECEEPFKEVDPGDQFSFQFKIRNEGNDQDTIKISIHPASEKRLDDMSWAVMLSTLHIFDEGSDQVVKISITPASDPPSRPEEKITLGLSIYSYQALALNETPVESSLFLRVHVRAYPDIDLQLCFQMVVILIIGIMFLISFFIAWAVIKDRKKKHRARLK